ncbi:hypothetical protein PLICRDRAFT_336874 [Plicaturopsis crispa FD-325 SS-3]|uniref:Fungal-type protein kinase domain-containing protein n=1 Tax=Plicaturopsis crispa FD-325 SS-3 TaxID=944288 RepID=A0A0C9SS35_PLICR|nr:hypothetical protein PLICRDRAFT_336874 [Plicaturopsis crispa FD-325 SS-3]
MYWRDADNVVHGILNDYDNAVRLDENKDPIHPPSSHRTGTLPFMALDFLQKHTMHVTHCYRHDLESFTYVLLWVTVRHPTYVFKNPAEQAVSAASIQATENWACGTLASMISAKLTTSRNFMNQEIMLSKPFSRLRILVKNALRSVARGNEDSADEYAEAPQDKDHVARCLLQHRETLFDFGLRLFHPKPPAGH